MVRRRGGRPHRLLPAAALTSEDAVRLRDLLRPALAEHGLDYSAALIPTGPRSFINVVLVVFDTSDEEQTRSAFAVAAYPSPSSVSSTSARAR